jgi:hypothetical protein
VIDASAMEKLTTESISPKSYNFNPEKNIAIDAMSSFEKHRDIQSRDTDNKHLLNEKSIASVSDDKDFINNFPIHDCINDNKIEQKLCIHAHDSDQISSITYNDISYNLGQKSPNGSSDLKDDDRYDKRLNQSNIKPSISNVFNSLNEYINAPTGSLDYVEHMLDKTDDLSKMSVSTTIKDFKSNKAINEETLKEKEIIATDTSIMDYKDNQPVKLDAFLEIDDKCDNVISNIASQHLILMQSEKKNSDITTSTSNIAVLRQEHDNVAINIEISKNEAAINEKTLLKNEMSFEEISKNIVDKQKQSDTKIQNHINKCILVENKENVMECMKSDENVKNDKSNNEETAKYYDILSNMHETHTIAHNDFSEKELNRYLLELEKEEEKSKIQNTLCVDDSSSLYDESRDIEAKFVNQHQDDEDINEAPIFEKIMIGELPKISEEIFQEKAKKFPVIDYGTSTCDENVNIFASKMDLREFNDTTKVVSNDKSNQLKGIQNNELSKVIKDNDITGPINEDLGMQQNKAKDSQSTSSIIVTEKASKLENVEEQYNSHNVLNAIQKLEQDINVNMQGNDKVKNLLENENCNDRIHCQDMTENNEDDKHDGDTNSKLKITSKIVNVSTISQVDENGQETEKPSRPQTLDIISTHNKDSHILGMSFFVHNSIIFCQLFL